MPDDIPVSGFRLAKNRNTAVHRKDNGIALGARLREGTRHEEEGEEEEKEEVMEKEEDIMRKKTAIRAPRRATVS